MDLQKGLPLTILAVVAVLAVVGMVLMYNSETTGYATIKSYSKARIKPPTKTKGLLPAWGHAVRVAKPRQKCYMFSLEGELYDQDDVNDGYIDYDKMTNTRYCVPYFALDDTQSGTQRCCILD